MCRWFHSFVSQNIESGFSGRGTGAAATRHLAYDDCVMSLWHKHCAMAKKDNLEPVMIEIYDIYVARPILFHFTFIIDLFRKIFWNLITDIRCFLWIQLEVLFGHRAVNHRTETSVLMPVLLTHILSAKP